MEHPERTYELDETKYDICELWKSISENPVDPKTGNKLSDQQLNDIYEFMLLSLKKITIKTMNGEKNIYVNPSCTVKELYIEIANIMKHPVQKNYETIDNIPYNTIMLLANYNLKDMFDRKVQDLDHNIVCFYKYVPKSVLIY